MWEIKARSDQVVSLAGGSGKIFNTIIIQL
jgi:hypothetical protein